MDDSYTYEDVGAIMTRIQNATKGLAVWRDRQYDLAVAKWRYKRHWLFCWRNYTTEEALAKEHDVFTGYWWEQAYASTEQALNMLFSAIIGLDKFHMAVETKIALIKLEQFLEKEKIIP